MTLFKHPPQTAFKQGTNHFRRPVHTHPYVSLLRFEGIEVGLKTDPSNAKGRAMEARS